MAAVGLTRKARAAVAAVVIVLLAFSLGLLLGEEGFDFVMDLGGERDGA